MSACHHGWTQPPECPTCVSDERDRLVASVESLQNEVANERELRIMQLAGISTASIQNTDSTIKDRIGKDNQYWSQAYLDVCVAIDREMQLRKERDELRRRNAALASALRKVVSWYDSKDSIDVLIDIEKEVKEALAAEGGAK